MRQSKACARRFLLVQVLASLVLPAAAVAQISGFVIDKAANLPVEGARVSVQLTGDFVLTSGDGAFTLPNAQGVLLNITAAKVGYFTGSMRANTGATTVRIELEPVPQEDNPNYEFKAPTTCSLCHIVQYEQWANSPMALAGQNAWTYDVYDGSGTPNGEGGFVYTRDSAHAGINPNSECASCHQPQAWIKQPHTALEKLGDLSRDAIHGVSCEVCHKIAHIDTTRKNTPGIWPGVVTITRPNSPTTPVMYGVLGDVDYHVSTMRSSYQPQLVASACAACHQDKNDPDNDGDFEEANGIVSEPTYNEWRATPYGDESSPMYASCVDCHMPAYGDSLVCRVLWQFRPPDRIRSHRIEGTTPMFLENAVSMQLDVQESTPGTFEVQVAITNDGAGHHVPTGVSIRNLVLLVEAWELQSGEPLESLGDQVIHELGGIGDPEQGYYGGLPGKLYGKITRGPDGTSPVFFTEAVEVVSDTRIPALTTDVTQYRFQRASVDGTVQVRARLIYRRAWRAMVDRKGWKKTGHGEPLADIAAPHYGHLMEESVWSSSSAYVRSFDAVQEGDDVHLQWNVEASIRDLQGYRLYRSTADGGVEKLHSEDMLSRATTTWVDRNLPAGQQLAYTLGLVLTGGSEIEAPVVDVFTPAAHAVLEQNYPNPFNPRTSIAYVVPAGGAAVRLRIFDARGRFVRTLVDAHEAAGRWVVEWDGTDARGVVVGSGMYSYQLQAGGETFTRRMLLLK